MTPKQIDKDVEKLIDRLNASHEPLYLNVESEPGAEVNDCFPVVQRKVKKDGGKMIMGWQIWKTRHLVEAECHAVWEDPDGNLHDITPKDENVLTILFVEDEHMIYEEKQIDNVRMNISGNPLVDDLIKVCEAIYEFDNKGERALRSDLSDVLDDRQKQFKLYLISLKNIIKFILSGDGSRKSKCPCKSGLKFKDCHRQYFNERVSKDA